MLKKYEKEIDVPESIRYELVGRAALFFARAYPKNDEALWWKIPEAFETVIQAAYRAGYASGAGIKQVEDGPKNIK